MAAGFAYFDTSVLVKRYVREAGSKRARELLRQYRFLSSTIMRKKRSPRLPGGLQSAT
jgi:hypothetical protein